MKPKKPKGIRRTAEGAWQVFVRRDGRFKSKTFKATTNLRQLKREREKLIAGLIEPEPDEATPAKAARGTLEADAEAYLALVTGMPSYDDRAYEIGQWVEELGERSRARLTGRDIRAVLERWRLDGRADGSGGLSAGSLNRRRTALMSLYTTLDGKSAANPVKDVPEYDETESRQIRSRDPRLLYRLIARIGRRRWKSRRPANRGKPHPPSKTRARLRLMLWTGWPQKQIMQLTPEAIDWTHLTVWVTPRRKGKGAKGRWLPLMFEGSVRALKAFVAAKAWGHFSTSGMHSALARAVDEENVWRVRMEQKPIPPVHPYAFRHTFGTELAKIVKDERVIQELMLHATPMQSRIYTEAATAPRLLEARTALTGPKVAGMLRKPDTAKKKAKKRSK